MKIKPLKQRDFAFSAYVDYMAEQIRKLPRKPASTVQSASMQATLDRDPSKDAEHFSRKLDLSKAQIAHSEKEMEKFERRISPQEFSLIEEMRHKGHGNTIGQYEKSSPTEENKQKAIHAFTYSEPAPLSDLKIKELTKIEPITELKEYHWKEMSFTEAVVHWFKGNKIEKTNKGE